jgi:hypothetical protein
MENKDINSGVFLTKEKTFEVKEIPLPEPRDDEVLL